MSLDCNVSKCLQFKISRRSKLWSFYNRLSALIECTRIDSELDSLKWNRHLYTEILRKNNNFLVYKILYHVQEHTFSKKITRKYVTKFYSVHSKKKIICRFL